MILPSFGLGVASPPKEQEQEIDRRKHTAIRDAFLRKEDLDRLCLQTPSAIYGKLQIVLVENISEMWGAQV